MPGLVLPPLPAADARLLLRQPKRLAACFREVDYGGNLMFQVKEAMGAAPFDPPLNLDQNGTWRERMAYNDKESRSDPKKASNDSDLFGKSLLAFVLLKLGADHRTVMIDSAHQTGFCGTDDGAYITKDGVMRYLEARHTTPAATRHRWAHPPAAHTG